MAAAKRPVKKQNAKKPAVIKPKQPQTNLDALEMVIDQLRHAGRIERIDEAVVMAARALAAQVDDKPDNAALWREYRAAEQTLRGISTYADDAFSLLIDQLHAES
jgi:hypothetical protein